MINPSLYTRDPLRIEEGIPVFDETDEYIDNYERIAKEHLAGLAADIGNPFMVTRQIVETIEAMRELVTQNVAAGSRILDVGVGTGTMLAPLEGYERYGLDISLAYLKEAQSRLEEVCLSRIETAPFADASFDAIVTTDVLEHVLGLDRAVEQLTRMLKPGGVLIVNVPNMEPLDSYVGDDSPYKFVHLRNFSLSGLRLYFETIFDYTYVRHRYSGWLFNAATSLKVRMPTKSDPLREALRRPEAAIAELERLKASLTYTEEELVDDLIAVRDQHPNVADIIFPLLMRPAELACVFRKSHS
jgi:2-polyprenyl-3-methyl-5-hydroxy-6-metoxy-1,4-benzoquinol methylase